MNNGFISPDGTYWETISKPLDKTREAYPKGTIEVPLRPDHLHTWNGQSWIPPSTEVLYEYLSQRVRDERNTKLVAEVDPIVSNPLRWAEFSEEEKNKWVTYRRELLEVSNQAEFPFDVKWPIKPI
jgi:hypothetical protein